MITVRAKIKAAEKASDVIVDSWNEAVKELSGPLLVNGLGVIDDPSMSMGHIYRAHEALEKAISAYRDARPTWPTNADYEAVDG